LSGHYLFTESSVTLGKPSGKLHATSFGEKKKLSLYCGNVFCLGGKNDSWDALGRCRADAVFAVFVSWSFLVLRQLPSPAVRAIFFVCGNPKSRFCVAKEAIGLWNRLEHPDELS
jgi:hypothetical protein